MALGTLCQESAEQSELSLPEGSSRGEKPWELVIYSKEYTFGLHACFWRRAPKTLGISYVNTAVKAS